MIGKSIPKLLQEARKIKEALETIPQESLPPGMSVAELEARITNLETVVRELDTLAAERTRLVNSKGDYATTLNDYLIQLRFSIRGVFGSDSSEYEMMGGTRKSERKKPKRKPETPQ